MRRSGTRVIATIASFEVRVCELGSFVPFAVLEDVVGGFSEHVQELYNLFNRFMQDPESSDVRVTTV